MEDAINFMKQVDFASPNPSETWQETRENNIRGYFYIHFFCVSQRYGENFLFTFLLVQKVTIRQGADKIFLRKTDVLERDYFDGSGWSWFVFLDALWLRRRLEAWEKHFPGSMDLLIKLLFLPHQLPLSIRPVLIS